MHGRISGRNPEEICVWTFTGISGGISASIFENNNAIISGEIPAHIQKCIFNGLP